MAKRRSSARSPKTRMSDAAAADLALRLNASVLPEPAPAGTAPTSQAPDAASLRKRIAAIDWFAHCGTPLDQEIGLPTASVNGWAKATRACRSRAWENVQLQAQNRLTGWLHEHAHAQYQKWNRWVDRHKAGVLRLVLQDRLPPVLRKLGLDECVLHSVSWDLLGALMEGTYADTGHPSRFFLELLRVYEAGRFPCGWKGVWPAGSLLVH